MLVRMELRIKTHVEALANSALNLLLNSSVNERYYSTL